MWERSWQRSFELIWRLFFWSDDQIMKVAHLSCDPSCASTSNWFLKLLNRSQLLSATECRQLKAKSIFSPKIISRLPWGWRSLSPKKSVSSLRLWLFTWLQTDSWGWMLKVISKRNLDVADIYLQVLFDLNIFAGVHFEWVHVCPVLFIIFICSTSNQNSDSAQFPAFGDDKFNLFLLTFYITADSGKTSARTNFTFGHCLYFNLLVLSHQVFAISDTSCSREFCRILRKNYLRISFAQ